MAEPKYIDSGATFDSTRTYRYSLYRVWDGSKRAVAFIMLNPSTADEFVLDPTVRRCLGYAMDKGYGSLWVLNLYALRSTDPKQLKTHKDPVGPENDNSILRIVEFFKTEMDLVVAWGNYGRHYGRESQVLKMLHSYDLYCLGTTKMGSPVHPLYQPRDVDFKIYQRKA